MSAERIQYENIPARPERNIPGDSETSSRDGLLIDVNRLIALTERHPVVRRPVSEFMHRLDVDCWSDSHERPFTPRTLIALLMEQGEERVRVSHPEYARHIEKIMRADYSQPLHVYGDWLINGTHRLAKLALARERGETTQDFLTVKELREIPKETILRTDFTLDSE